VKPDLIHATTPMTIAAIAAFVTDGVFFAEDAAP
jgi:hypothetical protein